MRTKVTPALVALSVVSLLACAKMANGQNPLPLITLTNLWRYNTNNLELGTAWRAPAFNDSGWQGPGLALFGFETDELQYNNLGVYFNTHFTDPFSDRPFITNYYFRTHFQFPAYPAAVLAATTLATTNWFDDGVIYYLNGVELLRTNVPSGTVTAATFALSALLEPVQKILTNSGASSLVVGDNVLAAELHQSSTNTQDEVFGMTMTAILPSPIVITTQPVGATNIINTPVTLSVAASGTSPSYQWYSNGVAIAAGGNPSLAVASNQTIVANYTVAISNVFNAVTSAVARVEYVTDNLPIELVKASSSDPTMAVAGNQVLIAFNKRVQNDSVAHDPANYTISVLGTADSLVVTNVQVATLVKLTANSALGLGTNYILTVNNVSGTNHIPIAPNSMIGIGMPIFVPLTNIFSMNQPWYWTEQPTDLAPGWNGTNYIANVTRSDSEFWGEPPGPGLLWHDALFNVQPCLGSRGENISWGYNTYFLRTSFVAPAGAAASGILRFSVFLNDGVIFYLNGSEVARIDMPPGPATYATTALASNAPACAYINVAITNLIMPGTNILAAEWHQYDPNREPTIYFGAALDYSYTNANASPLPPRLTVLPLFTTNDNVVAFSSTNVISWPTNVGGYFWGLEFTTNLSVTNTTWIRSTNSSPYTNSTDGSRFFRLHAAPESRQD